MSLQQAVLCRNVLSNSIVSGTTPKRFQSGSDGEKGFYPGAEGPDLKSRNYRQEDIQEPHF